MPDIEEANKLINESDELLKKGEFSRGEFKLNEALKIALIFNNKDIQFRIQSRLTQIKRTKARETLNQLELIQNEAKNFMSQKNYKDALIEFNEILRMLEMDETTELDKNGVFERKVRKEILSIEIDDLINHKDVEIDNERSTVLLEKIVEEAKQLMNSQELDELTRFIDSISKLLSQLNSSRFKTLLSKEIERFKYELTILNVKKTIEKMKNIHKRIQIREIAEECNIQNDVILNVLNEMIETNELKAKYFKATDTVVFDISVSTNLNVFNPYLKNLERNKESIFHGGLNDNKEKNFCIYCGKEILNDDQIICEYCGKDQTEYEDNRELKEL